MSGRLRVGFVDRRSIPEAASQLNGVESTGDTDRRGGKWLGERTSRRSRSPVARRVEGSTSTGDDAFVCDLIGVEASRYIECDVLSRRRTLT